MERLLLMMDRLENALTVLLSKQYVLTMIACCDHYNFVHFTKLLFTVCQL